MKTEKLSDAITIINADCREWSGNADAVISDPPYGIAYTAGVPSRLNSTGNVNLGSIIGDDDKFDPSRWTDFPAVILWGANHFARRLPCGGRWLAWNKLGTLEPWDQFSDVEFAWNNRKGADKIFSHLWKGLCQAGRGEKRRHPMQKPVELMVWCFEQAKVSDGATVLDPYMGSGTTGIACIRTGRRFIGIEIDEQHYQTARRRLMNEIAQTNLFRQDEDARAGQGECPGTACNSGRDAMPIDIFEGVQ
jgi:site-specific DNA-methyltransferase (adenine-specific)